MVIIRLWIIVVMAFTLVACGEPPYDVSVKRIVTQNQNVVYEIYVLGKYPKEDSLKIEKLEINNGACRDGMYQYSRWLASIESVKPAPPRGNELKSPWIFACDVQKVTLHTEDGNSTDYDFTF